MDLFVLLLIILVIFALAGGWFINPLFLIILVLVAVVLVSGVGRTRL